MSDASSATGQEPTLKRDFLSHGALECGDIAKSVAVRVGFEPTLRFPVNTLSKRAPSATRPPHPTVGPGEGPGGKAG